MNVLLVSPLPPPMGGIATLTERMMNNLSSPNITIRCVNVAHKVNETNNNITKYGKIESVKILCRSLSEVFIKCKKKECDIIHINSSSGGGTLRDYLIGKIAKGFHIPIIIHYHCNIENAVKSSSIAKILCSKCFALADRILVLNRSSQQFIEKKGYDSIIVPNGIPRELIVLEHSINEKIECAVFTGRVSEAKGCLELYECAKSNPQITFLLAGLIEEELEEKLRTLKNIRLLGVLQHEEIIELLDLADIFVFPTYSEGFSVSLLEAMARGVPCITTDVGANKDMIEGKGGIVVEVKNARAVIKAMEKMQDPGLRSSMSKWNLKKVLDLYTEEKMFEKFISIYSDVVVSK